MISTVTEQFCINRILLLAVGLWPYQRSKLIRFQMILFFTILSSFTVFQLTTFLTAEFSLNLVINVLSSVLCFISIVINYSWFCNNLQIVKNLLDQLQHICNDIKDENELYIIEKYGENAKRLTTRVSMFCMCIVFIFVTQPIWPRILGFFPFINESQPQYMMYFMTEYFVDDEKYFYLILLHMYTASCVGVMITVAVGLMVIVLCKYACGMFRIASYRIEQAVTINTLQNINLEGGIVIHKKIIFAVDIHRKAMQFIEHIATSFEAIFFFLVGIAVACMSLNLFGIASFKNDARELLQPLLRGSGILLCMFIANYAGQEISDHSNHVFFTAYNIQWYKTPVYIQKMILFLLQRSNKAFNLTIGGLFVPSLDGFATMMTTSISYFTVIYSIQH